MYHGHSCTVFIATVLILARCDALVSNITYGQGQVCPQAEPRCKWGVPTANRTGYVPKDLQLDYYPPHGTRLLLPPTIGKGRAALPSKVPALIIVHGGAYWTGSKVDPIVIQRAQYFQGELLAHNESTTW